MSSSKTDQDYMATRAFFENDALCVELSDGREIRVPLEYYPRLRDATQQQRENYELIGMGTGIHWPEVDEDLSVNGIVLGIPARS